MKKIFTCLALVVLSSAAFANVDLNGDDAQTMYDILARNDLAIPATTGTSASVGIKFAQAFSVFCVGDRCFATKHFIDPALDRETIIGNDAKDMIKLLVKAGGVQSTSNLSDGTNGQTITPGGSVGCELETPSLKTCKIGAQL